MNIGKKSERPNRWRGPQLNRASESKTDSVDKVERFLKELWVRWLICGEVLAE